MEEAELEGDGHDQPDHADQDQVRHRTRPVNPLDEGVDHENHEGDGDQGADDVSLGLTDPGTQQALPDGTQAEGNHQEHEPDSNRPQVDHVFVFRCLMLVAVALPCRTGFPKRHPLNTLPQGITQG